MALKIGAPDPGDFPGSMRSAKRWVTWTYLNSKKPPCDGQGKPLANWKDPDNWLTWEEAANVMADSPAVSGLGFVLGDDGEGSWVGLDLDKCRNPDTGELDPRAEALLEVCAAGCYAEVSPSQTGVKAFGRAPAPEWVEVNLAEEEPVLHTDRAVRFFAVTGDGLEGYTDPTKALDLKTIKAMHGDPEPGTQGAEHVPAPKVVPDVVQSGSQNAQLYREACRNVRMGKTEPEVFAIVKAYQQARCPNTPGSAPWTDADFHAIVQSALKHAPALDNFGTNNVGDARAFAHLYSDRVRYDHRRGRWLVYDGTRWAPDHVAKVRELAIESQHTRHSHAGQMKAQEPESPAAIALAKWTPNGFNTSRLDSLLKEASALAELKSSGEEWDQNPMVLGVPNGVVDLVTGQLRPGEPEDRITKQAAYIFDPEAKCPLWEATVADIFKDQPEIVPYFQRALGYSLTGDCREEVFFILLGEGRNGKGTLINTVEAILGDYTTNLSMRSLEASQNGATGSAASPDIAKLDGARFVTASETTGGRFNTALLKGLTGRDRISARHLHQDEFEFVPQLKLWLSLNEMPRVTDTSIGFWERPHLIPFNQCYKDNPDRTLKDRLLEEGEGILAWLVRGCLSWQHDGLGKPAKVEAAVKSYQTSQEPLAQFKEERLHEEANAQLPAGAAYEEYKAWADEARLYGRQRLTLTAFGRWMSKTYPKTRTKRGNVYTGVRLTRNGEEF